MEGQRSSSSTTNVTEYCVVTGRSNNVELQDCHTTKSSGVNWTLNTAGRTAGFLQSAGGCLVAVPDNSNNTIVTAVSVIDETGSLVRSKTPATAVNASHVDRGVTATVSLKSGATYTIVVAVQTLRDIGCAGTRAETSKCARSLEDETVSHAASLARPGAVAAACAAQANFWKLFWNASAIDITGGHLTAPANATEIEKWYYGMQYSFGANVRQGKVTPSLSGVLVNEDPVPWNDQFTLDVRTTWTCPCTLFRFIYHAVCWSDIFAFADHTHTHTHRPLPLREFIHRAPCICIISTSRTHALERVH
jgi:hypothetical protein